MALYTERHYADNCNELAEKYAEKWWCDYERYLGWRIPTFEELPEEWREKALNAIIPREAEKVAKDAEAELIRSQKMIQDIRNGKSSLGYTNKAQGIRAWHDLQEGFEYASWCLKQFKQKYGV